MNAGFSEEAAKKLILRKSSTRTVAAVLKYSEKLSAEPYFLTKAQIVQIAAHDGGSKNIEAVKSSFEALQALGFSSEQIVTMSKHHGGSKNIKAVKSSFRELKALGFSCDQIVKMSGNIGGSFKLQAVIDYYPMLQLRGYTTDWMVSLVIRASSLNEIKKQAEKFLTHELPEEFPVDDDNPILDIEPFEWSLAFDEEESDIADKSCFEPLEIRCTGKRDNPLTQTQDLSAEHEPISLSEALLRESSLLERSRNEDAERSDSISPKTSTSGLIRQGVTHLEALSRLNIPEPRYHDERLKLVNAGFSEEEAKKLILQKWSSRTVTAVLEHAERLSAAPYFLTKAEIVRIAAHDGGSINIETVFLSFTALQALGFTADQIVKMSGHIGGSKNIETVLLSFTALQALGFTAEHIVKMSAHDGGSRNIEAVQSSFAALQGFRFTVDQIVKISGHIGGSKNIKAVRSSFTALQDLGFTADQMVRMSAHHGGSLKLQAVIDYYPRLQGHGYTTDWMVALVIRAGSLNEIKKQVEKFLTYELPEKLPVDDDNPILDADLCDFLLALEKEDRDIADPSCAEPSEIRCTGKRSAEDDLISLVEPLLGDNGLLKRSRNEDREPFDPMPSETSTFGLIPSEKGRSLSFLSAASASASAEDDDLYYCPNESAFTL